MRNINAEQFKIEKTHTSIDYESLTTPVNLALILLVVLTLALAIVLLHEKRKELSFTVIEMMNPYGSGNQRITRETRCYYNRTVAEKYYKDENGIVVGHEIFDKGGNLKEGWKYENGTYYEWVLYDENNPQKGGKWAEKTPPPDRTLSNLRCL